MYIKRRGEWVGGRRSGSEGKGTKRGKEVELMGRWLSRLYEKWAGCVGFGLWASWGWKVVGIGRDWIVHGVWWEMQVRCRRLSHEKRQNNQNDEEERKAMSENRKSDGVGRVLRFRKGTGRNSDVIIFP
jgi:hypothetical protein